MRRALAAIVVMALTSVTGCGRSRPNVLILVMDTTRGDRVSINGYARPTTPRLEEWAKSSVTFRNAWAPEGWTGPTHASLFTGLEPRRHGFVEGNRPFLGEEATTLAERLKDAGYKTACYSNNWVVSPEWGLTQGCELYEAMYKVERTATPARETHRRALAWAVERKAAGEPFYLFINDIEPHVPYAPPRDVAQRFLPQGVDEDELQAAMKFNHPDGMGYIFGAVEVSDERIRLFSDLYDAEIAALDAEIGSLLDGLSAAGILDETLVVITADHGENLGDHGLLDHKFSLHRTLTHVPLLVRWPGDFSAGRTVDDVVRLEDIAPTVLDVLGLDRKGLDGASLRGDVSGRLAYAGWGAWRRAEEEMRRLYPSGDLTPLFLSIEAVTDERHHFMRYSDGREELYDVVADPAEVNNLAASEPELRDRMFARLRR